MPRPKFHLTPTKNWMNDPNGFIYYKGKYHLFYQHYPEAVHWGTMHWGHKISPDLLHWEDLGIALYPDREFDANGVFSGTAMELDGKLALYYTAILYDAVGPEKPYVTAHALLASQAMITSQDGFTFHPSDKQVIVPQFAVEKDDEVAKVDDQTRYGNSGNVRDPKVWKQGDTYYMLLGSQHPQERPSKTPMQGELLLYTSSDGIHFSFAKVFRFPELDTEMFECPDLFSVHGQEFFITSPFGDERPAKEYKDMAYIAKAHMDYDRLDLTIGALRLLDYGQDYYAPQTTLDAAGNRILIGWLRMPEACCDEGTGEQWIGAFTFPRVIDYRDGILYTHVHPNVKAVFAKPFVPKASSFVLPKDALRIEAEFTAGDSMDLGGYRVSYDGTKVSCDRTGVFGDYEKIANRFATPEFATNGTCHLSIYLDDPIVEVYVNDGQYVISNVVYGNLRNFSADIADTASLHFYTD